MGRDTQWGGVKGQAGGTTVSQTENILFVHALPLTAPQLRVARK